jgi:hypothetical protein
MGFTFRNSLSSWGGYRGGCGVTDGEDLVRRTPNLPRRLLLRDVLVVCCAWERTKVIDGSVGSGERISLIHGTKERKGNESRVGIGRERRTTEGGGEGPG